MAQKKTQGRKKAPAGGSKKKDSTPKKATGSGKRTYVSQSDVPAYSLAQAIRVPRAIGEHYAFGPTSPLNVAAALNMQPNSSRFRQLCGAAIAYGLTSGGPNAKEISIEPLGLRVVRPTEEGDDTEAKREALLKPRVVGEFLRKYDGAAFPREDIGRNVLVEMGVPQDRVEGVQESIVEGADAVGILRTIKGKRYVNLSGVSITEPSDAVGGEVESPEADNSTNQLEGEDGDSADTVPVATAAHVLPDDTTRRVFITHGKNKAFVDPIKKLLGFGELKPVVSVEKTSVSQPVPDKVMSDMRACGSAIIHVDAEKTITDTEGDEHTILNPNVLIEIGAAMALYGRRFILLVKEGVKLPSNLQGLFEVRYTGDALDGDATIRLLEATNDIKNHPLPDRYSKTT